MLPRLLMLLVLNLILCLVSPAPGAAAQSAEEVSAQALAACQEGRGMHDPAERLAQFQRAETLAERAIGLKDDLPAAHFALFCGLGEQLRLKGEGLTALFRLPRVLAELDRTLTLDPNHLAALSAKGTLLQRLPSALGGDEAQGEQLLRRVVNEAPLAVNARLGLARACAKRGEHEAARAYAAKALAIAKVHGPQDLIPEAQSTLTAVQAMARRVAWTGLRGQ